MCINMVFLKLHSIVVVRILASHQKVCGLNLCGVCTLHSWGFSGFLPLSKNTFQRGIGDSKLSLRCECVSVFLWWNGELSRMKSTSWERPQQPWDPQNRNKWVKKWMFITDIVFFSLWDRYLGWVWWYHDDDVMKKTSVCSDGSRNLSCLKRVSYILK